MAIGRISGSVLKSNLTRNGTDLAFETNLLYLDVTNSRVGIGTSEPTTALDVSGTVNATAFVGDGSGLTGINVSTNIQIVGDDSTGAILGTGETFKIAGGNNITTAISGDTLTVTGSKDININSITSDDSTAIQINDNINIAGNILPTTTLTYNLGSTDYRFNELWLAGTTIDLGGTKLSIDESGDFEIKDSGGNRKNVVADSVLIGSGASKIKLSRGNNGKLKFTDENDTNTAILTVVGDDSTGINLNPGETFKIAGGTNITTAVSDDTVTITGPDISSFITASSTNTLTNKTIDANGTGNSISNLEVADFAGSAIITVSETLAANDSDSALVTAGAIIDYVDAQDANIASDTLTFTNKTFDANGTGNAISNIEVGDFAAGVLDIDLSSVSASDDTIASAKAIKAYVDAQNQSQALTFVGDDSTGTAVNSGETFKVAGTGGITTSVSGDTLTVDGSSISTNSISEGDSNVTVTDSGTGAITIAADGSTIVTFNATTAIDASAVTNAIRLPNGTTGERPSGSVGMIRYNSTSDTIEGYTSAGGWAQLGATTATAENTNDTTSGTATQISTTAKVVDQFVTSTFDSAIYYAITRDEINDEVSTARYSLVHNDSDAFVAESHITESDPTNSYITVSADVTGGSVRLLATSGSVVNSVSFYRVALGDNTSAATTGNVTTFINADVDSASEKIDGWALASYRGAKYILSINNSTTGEVSNTEALVVHDGSTAYITQYGSVNSGNNDLITLTAEIDSTEVILKASAQAPDCRVTGYRILLSDSESASDGNNIATIASTTVNSSATQIDSFTSDSATGAFYIVTGYNSAEGVASISEVTVVTDGTNAYVSAGPTVSTKGTDQLEFTATLTGNTVALKAASTSGASTTVNGYRVHLLRGTAGAAIADTVLVSTEQTITGAKTFDAPIALTVGSDPATVANTAHIYAKDEASSAEVYVRDEAGNVTKISPHNALGEWEYYSRNTRTGKTVRINMEELVRDIEQLTGKTYIKDQ